MSNYPQDVVVPLLSEPGVRVVSSRTRGKSELQKGDYLVDKERVAVEDGVCDRQLLQHYCNEWESNTNTFVRGKKVAKRAPKVSWETTLGPFGSVGFLHLQWFSRLETVECFCSVVYSSGRR